MSTPEQFVERLMSHFSKRHADEKAEQIWFDDIVKTLKGYDPRVLDVAADLLIEERTEIRFPLPAEIRQFCSAASKQIYGATPEPRDKYADLPPPTDEERARVQQIVEDAKRAIMSKALPAEPKAPFPDVSRPAFEKMQRESPNPGLHMTRQGLTDLSKRITGDREDAA